MKEKMLEKNQEINYKRLKDLIDDLDIETVGKWFQEELKITSKDVTVLREKIEELKELVLEATNGDEKIHLNYDIEDYEDLFKTLLAKLETLSKKYQRFLEYTD